MAGPSRRLIVDCCRALNGLAARPNHGRATTRSLLQIRHFSPSVGTSKSSNNNDATIDKNTVDTIVERMGKSLQEPAGLLYGKDEILDEDNADGHQSFIPQVPLHGDDGRNRKRILVYVTWGGSYYSVRYLVVSEITLGSFISFCFVSVIENSHTHTHTPISSLCTGGTLTMAPNSNGALAPVEGALSKYMEDMDELRADKMPDFVLHEYTPFYDSSDLGPADWARVARDIKVNYLHFDGFVVCTGTDTMAYFATALSFMLENLGKPVVFTGSQIPLCEPYNDARRNLIMSLIFASRDSINEVTIFFHDRLLRACRSTKVCL